jgi:hypothetical protein
MRRVLPFVCVIALGITVGAQPAKSPQKPGKWQIKMEMEMPGMPMKMPPITTEVCLTEAELADPQKAVPNDPKSDCKVGEYKVKGNTVTWNVECPKQNMKGDGEITFTDDAYAGRMNMTVGDRKMATKYTGKWLGACTK